MLSNQRGVCLLLVIVASATISINSQTISSVNDYLFSGSLEFIDLTHPFNNDTLAWPGNRKFAFTKKIASNKNGFWYSSNEFCSAEHSGTHIDAPYHFAEDKWTLGQIPFDNFITPLYVVDVSKVVNGNPEFVLQKHHMDSLFHLDPRRNHTILFRFGWSEFYGDREKYFGTNILNNDNFLQFPGISEEVAKWLTETSRNIVGVAVDTPSVDAGSDRTYPAHKTFASKNIFMLENVKVDKTLLSNKCAIVVMPMKIQEGTGGPVRLTAICPRLNAHDLF